MDVLLETNQTIINQVRQFYKIKQLTIDQYIEILQKWIEQQPHLPQDQDKDFLERLLLRNKFRIEVTKEKLENYYTLRGIYREFYQKFNHEFIPSKETVSILPFPKLTTYNERIYVMHLNDLNPENYNITHISKFAMLLGEIVMRHDYAIGERIIIDCYGITLEHIKRISPMELDRAIYVYRTCYSARPITIDIINTPTFLNIILNLLKLALPTKIYKKINVHGDLESLYKSCPKECLPKDYGGDLNVTIVEINRKWDGIFANYQEFFTKNYDRVSNEHLRIGKVGKSEIFGTDGTFKKINLD